MPDHTSKLSELVVGIQRATYPPMRLGMREPCIAGS